MLLTLKQASRLTGYSEDTLRNRIKEGIIHTTMIKNRYMIDEKDLIGHAKKPSKKSVYEKALAERDASQPEAYTDKNNSTQTSEINQVFTDKAVKLLTEHILEGISSGTLSIGVEIPQNKAVNSNITEEFTHKQTTKPVTAEEVETYRSEVYADKLATKSVTVEEVDKYRIVEQILAMFSTQVNALTECLPELRKLQASNELSELQAQKIWYMYKFVVHFGKILNIDCTEMFSEVRNTLLNTYPELENEGIYDSLESLQKSLSNA